MFTYVPSNLAAICFPAINFCPKGRSLSGPDTLHPSSEDTRLGLRGDLEFEVPTPLRLCHPISFDIGRRLREHDARMYDAGDRASHNKSAHDPPPYG
jgi:hypothetical protein